ncbi:MAG: carboxypeptidase regulatory-like domain-containing protein [Gemmatimonadetes bacterium]|nr:carboxypeptidase regulatory-like domain-containing protein [Gemmatimonadota bacterium]
MKRVSYPLAGLTVCLVLASAVGEGLAAQSQTTSAIRGIVLQVDDTPLTEVTITVRHVRTGVEKLAITNTAGRFLVLLLQPGGPYELSASHLGYADLKLEGIQLQVGETQTLVLYLSEQAIEVAGIAVNVERAEIFNPGQVGPATLLNERVVESVPILSRDVMELANLSPLVTTTANGGFSIAGQNDRYNQVLIDGVTHKDPFGLTASGVPGGQAGAKMLPIDAVAQFQIMVAPFDVRLSGFAGGVMNAITKVGTNDWHFRGFAVGRNEALMGDLSLPTGLVEASGVDRSLFGFSAGGPIVRDRVHFYISTEFEERGKPPTGFNLVRDDPAVIQISPESMGAFQDLFEGSFGVDTGLGGPYTLNQELANIFARVDASLGGGHRLTARNVFAWAQNDETPNRTAFEPYELSSNAILRESATNTASFQLFSEMGNGGGNELELSVQRTTDQTTPMSSFPQVEVDLNSPVGDGLAFTRAVRAGAHFFAQANDLEQTSFRLTDTFTLPTERGSTYTFGITGALNSIRHEYLPGALGDYFFASIRDVANNAPQRYQRTVLQPGQDPAINFSVLEVGGYVQNEIDAGKGLTMRFGMRVDIPYLLDKPAYNSEFDELFGFDTSTPPSGQILISPRWGFNWQSEGRRTTQVRGGAGFFTGQLPYVWLSNAFHNNGLRSITEVCTGRWTDDPLTGNTAPGFDAANTPDGCVNGPPITVRPVTVFDPDFKYPRYIKFSSIVDHELTDRLSGSLGFLFSMARKQVSIEEMNLDGPSGPLGPLEGYGGTERAHFGDPSPDGFTPNRKHPEYDQVLLVTNKGNDWTYSLSAEARGFITEELAFQGGYAYARSFDKQSLTSVDMISNFGFNATEGNPNSPLLTASNFDRPHKFVVSVYGRPFPSLTDTEFSLLYTGQSGLPFSYVYRGDLNGDGYPALGPAFDRFNDLIYVPNVASELPSGFATLALLSTALVRDPCLSAHKGEILRRNDCRAPWEHRLDLRVTHSIQAGSATVRFEADMINLLNFINSDWGSIQSIRSNVPLLEPEGREQSFGGVGELSSRWAGGALPARDEDGRLVPPDPWSVLTPDSQWQAQLGIRVTLGGSRR